MWRRDRDEGDIEEEGSRSGRSWGVTEVVDWLIEKRKKEKGYRKKQK